ncbi:MAG: hypothetical protein WC498_00160 [Candidatus Saccharimonadales bacterium]
MALILAVAIVSMLLVLSEFGWRRGLLKGEFGRKFVHITVGTFVAFWPFFMSWNQIRLASLAFLVVVVITKYFHIFRAISSVQRPTYGEVFFALIVGAMTFVTHSKGVYAAALLQMSLADGMAAVVGTYWGKDNKYQLLGHTKSIAGTATFLCLSFVILIGYSLLATKGLPITMVVFGSLSATILENLAAFGLDNLIVPLFVGILLTKL